MGKRAADVCSQLLARLQVGAHRQNFSQCLEAPHQGLGASTGVKRAFVFAQMRNVGRLISDEGARSADSSFSDTVVCRSVIH